MAENRAAFTALCSFILIVMPLLTIEVTAAAGGGYSNYTVGDNAGWFFDSGTNKTSADYSSWAANKTFDLGDYLIFNTNTNQTVIQTYNKTTYDSCSTDDALDTDTFQYGGGNDLFNQPETVSVPLTIEGTQYFFSDADDGLQCKNGMAFQINVSRGLGLPPSLNRPPPPPVDVQPPSGDGEGRTPVATTADTGGGAVLGYCRSWSWFCFGVDFVLVFRIALEI